MGDLEYHFEKISYGNSTTCVRADDLNLIEQTLTQILEKEGCRPIPKPLLPENAKALIQELRSSPWKMNPYLWVIGLAVGNLGWTIIKTSVTELLCRRARGSTRPRLSELAMHTGCDVFHCSVHDRYYGVVLEADASGQTFASGFLDCHNIENMKFYNEPVDELTGGLNFFLLNVPEEFQAAGRVKACLSKEEKQRREEELEALVQEHPEQFTRALTEWRELNMSSFERIDEDLGQLLCSSDSHSYYWHYWQGNKLWHEKNILHKVYTEPYQLESDGVRLLFFQVGGFDRRPDTEEIWSLTTNFDWANYAADSKKVNLGREQEKG